MNGLQLREPRRQTDIDTLDKTNGDGLGRLNGRLNAARRRVKVTHNTWCHTGEQGRRAGRDRTARLPTGRSRRTG